MFVVFIATKMVNISIQSTGDLHGNATHGPSQSKLATDAPTDNKGKGESFSPTEAPSKR
jgi:putative redox protein